MNAVKTEKQPLNVVFLADTGQIPGPLTAILENRSVPFWVLPIERFCEIEDKLEVIGTIIINAAIPDANQQLQLRRIIELLDAAGIATILLDKPAGFELDNYPLAAAANSDHLEELWGRISANLAYRAKATQHQSISKVEDQSEDGGKAAIADGLAEQLRMAGRVQRDFLPSHLPNTNNLRWVAIFRPAEWVSGDIYDVARLDERHIGFYIADAVGHSMPAALLTMFLKQALVMRKTIGNKYSIYEPSEVISNLNARMAEQNLSGCQFATCCYCLLNIWTLQLTFARAGHPYPVLVRPGESPRQLESQGALLGVFQHAQHKQHKIQLQRGDKLLLYSDGAEAFIANTDDAGAFTFNSQFRETTDLPIEQMLERLDKLVSTQKPLPPAADDITFIGLEIL